MEKTIEVLIIEDDKRIAEIHKRFIEKLEGFEVVGTAHTGEEAKLWISSLQPDLVLLDVYLPDMLGTDVLKIILDESPDTDVIFITAAAEADIVRKAFKSGVADYILKPLTFDKFKESLLSYKRKWDALNNAEIFEEESIHFLWNKGKVSSIQTEDPLPKGIDPITTEKVLKSLQTVTNGVTAEKLGNKIGVSRSTARRYLEYLVTEKKAYAELIYGSIGRPERRYFPKRTP